MKRISTVSILGFLVLLVASPYVAVSRVWKDYFLMLAGLVILVLSILIRKELHKVVRLVNGAEDIKSDTYVESNPQ